MCIRDRWGTGALWLSLRLVWTCNCTAAKFVAQNSDPGTQSAPCWTLSIPSSVGPGWAGSSMGYGLRPSITIQRPNKVFAVRKNSTPKRSKKQSKLEARWKACSSNISSDSRIYLCSTNSSRIKLCQYPVSTMFCSLWVRTLREPSSEAPVRRLREDLNCGLQATGSSITTMRPLVDHKIVQTMDQEYFQKSHRVDQWFPTLSLIHI